MDKLNPLYERELLVLIMKSGFVTDDEIPSAT
jgi:hypothetical protein